MGSIILSSWNKLVGKPIESELYNKMRNTKVQIDDMWFDSKAEGARYCELKLLRRAGVVKDFKIHPSFLLQEKFVKNNKKIRAISYEADFEVYYTDGRVEIEDVKGHETDIFKLKRKLFEYKYPDKEIILLNVK